MSAAQKTLLAVLAACACVLVGLTLHGLRSDPAATGAKPRSTVAAASSAGDTAPWSTPGAEVEAALPPGTVPVSAIAPPRPDPGMPMPPAVTEPANPALHRPPMDNPGGVDGDRPPRPVPGVD